MLPHRFPFRLVDRWVEGESPHAVAAITVGAALWRGRGGYPLGLAVEILAQASLLLLPPPAASTKAEEDTPASSGQAVASGAPPGLLAGIEEATLREELRAGDRLEAHTELVRRLGALSMVRGVLRRDGVEVASATLLLAQNG